MPCLNAREKRLVSRFQRLGVLIPCVTLGLFFITVLFGYYHSHQVAYEYTYNKVSRQMLDRTNFIQGTTEQFLALDMRERVQQLISNMASDRDLVSIHVVDSDDTVIASNHFGDVGTNWAALSQGLKKDLVYETQQGGPVVSHYDAANDTLETYAGLCGAGHSALLRGTRCGFINYKASIAENMRATMFTIRDIFIFSLLGMALVLMVSLALLHFLVARRAANISSLMKQFSAGNRSTRLQVKRRDEIGELSRSVNKLLDKIVDDEKEIRDAHERLHALFDNVIDSVIVINSRGIIESANPATAKVFGYHPEELIGRNVSVLMPEPVSSEHDQYIANYTRTGVKKIIGSGRKVEARHKSGRLFPADLAISEMYVKGERLFTGILSDISEQEALKAQMAKANEDLSLANQRLEELARTDKLTGIFNRGHFDETLNSEIARATRNSLPLSLLLLDVDYFKRFNDHYGHLDGDNCLREIASSLMSVCKRSGETVARYGGEEFAIILPHLDLEGARCKAEEVIQLVRDLQIPHAKSAISNQVTISIGAVTWQPASQRPIESAELVKSADILLYAAKAGGRNQACQDKFTTTGANGRKISGVKAHLRSIG